MRRLLLAAGAAVSMAVPLSAAGLATSAGAAVTPPTCAKLAGTIATSITVSKCSPTNAQYVSGSAPTSKVASGSGTLTWSPSKRTTTIKVTFKQSGTACPAGSTEYVAAGTVTGGTATYTAKGQAVSVKVCASSTGSLSLVPGTKAKL